MSRVSSTKLWARLAQLPAQIGPVAGPFWASKPKSLILNHYSTFRSKGLKMAYKCNDYSYLGRTCSLLRQVCGTSEPKGDKQGKRDFIQGFDRAT